MKKLNAVRGGQRSAVSRLIHKTNDKIEDGYINKREVQSAIQNLKLKQELLQNLGCDILDSMENSINPYISILRYQEVKLELKTILPKESVSEFASFSTMQFATASISHILNHNNNQHINLASTIPNTQFEHESVIKQYSNNSFIPLLSQTSEIILAYIMYYFVEPFENHMNPL